ncbi:Alpha/Beta hydrolase protein [Amylostereum chailletii]|nr:Alpha/Beta hydrolase protein [Amylostereum chailletii]
MLPLLFTLLSLALAFVANAFPTQEVLDVRPLASNRRPLVIWHGLGDSYASEGMVEFMSLIQDIPPGLFIHSVYIDEDNNEDRRAGFYGNLDDQLPLVAAQLATVPELSVGFDAIGFSQGGQFLRAYVERYNAPPVRNLVTFGAQHMGISDIPLCKPLDLICQVARRAARRGVYGAWAQEHLIQAQYYRDPSQLPLYLSTNRFLTSINNELAATRNATYARQLSSLSSLVLVLFAQDKTVVPKESSWFGSYAPPDEDRSASEEVVPMRAQPLYREDWIGLKGLDERGGVVLVSCEGEHMQLARSCWEPLVRLYAGSVVP